MAPPDDFEIPGADIVVPPDDFEMPGDDFEMPGDNFEEHRVDFVTEKDSKTTAGKGIAKPEDGKK